MRHVDVSLHHVLAPDVVLQCVFSAVCVPAEATTKFYLGIWNLCREVVLVISSYSVIVESFHGTTASLIFSYPLGPEFPDKDCGRGNIRSAWQVLVR